MTIATFTHFRWHDLIGQNPIVMRKMKAEFALDAHWNDDEGEEKMKAYQNCKMQFQHLSVDIIDFDGRYGLQAIQRVSCFSEHLKVVDLSKLRFSCEGMLFSFLNALKKLEKLIMFNVDYKEPEESDKVAVDATVPNLNLKKLILISTSKPIIESLVKTKLQSSHIMVSFTHMKWNGGRDYSHVVKLLNGQNKLTDLGLKTWKLEQQREVYQQLNANMKFNEHLKTLSVEFMAHVESDDDVPSTKKHFDHFIRCLSKMKSLEEVEIISFDLRVPQRVFTTMHKDLKLKKLHLEVQNLPESFVLNSLVISSNPHLKVFSSEPMRKEVPHEFANSFFRMFADIEDLIISGDLKNNIKHAADHLKKLKNLTVGVIKEDFPEHQIPTLQTFRAIRTDSIVGLQKFLDVNPSITSLRLHFPKTVFQTRIVGLLTRKLVNLDYLRLSGYANLNKNYEMCQSLSVNCPKLRAVKMHTMYSKDESDSDLEDSKPPAIIPKIKEHPRVKLMVSNKKTLPPRGNAWEYDEDFDIDLATVTEYEDAAYFYDGFQSSSDDDSDIPEFPGFGGMASRMFGMMPRLDRLTRQYDSDDSDIGWPGNGSNYFRNYDDWINRQEDWDYEDWQDFKEMFMDSD